MKLVSFLDKEKTKLGILINDKIYDLNAIDPSIPDNMADFLKGGEETMNRAYAVNANPEKATNGKDINSVTLMAPVPQPTSCRDGYAFRQHVASARRNRKVDMIPEFDQYPIFYFTNHNAIQGPGKFGVCPIIFKNWTLNWKLLW
jgi:fumarylacetoacetate (FAA) hydrolase